MILPIHSYACEIWGLQRADYRKGTSMVCKNLLRVKRSTQNLTVYGELGRYPLPINSQILVKYC